MSELRRRFFPYNVKQIAPGRYVILNRDYKPLGLSPNWVEYESDPSMVAMKITPKQAVKLSCRGDDNVEDIFLYHDGSVPTASAANMKAYLERLAVLMKLKST